jgi:ribokinase
VTTRRAGEPADPRYGAVVTTRHHPVIVVGSANVDLTTFVQRVPAPGETLIGSGFSMAAGGKGANQAIAVARAGARCVFVGCVGADPFADLIREGLAGVDTGFLREVPDEGTGVAHIRVDARGENDIVVVPRANALLTARDVDRALEAEGEQGGVLLLQLETPIDVAVHAARAAHARGMTVILDPAPAQPLPEKIWASIDIVTPNEGEARVLTGEADPDAASRWFLERGVGTALITLAGRGGPDPRAHPRRRRRHHRRRGCVRGCARRGSRERARHGSRGPPRDGGGCARGDAGRRGAQHPDVR